MEIRVINGDISSIESDALITAINSAGAWFGGIDGVIQRTAGNMFHSQAALHNLIDGTTVVAKATGPHDGKFQNVVFVVDDLQQPLHDVIMAGLKAADETGYKSVTLPTIRMGVMLGAVEKSIEEAVREMSLGVKAAGKSFKNLESVTFVVYQDQATEELLRQELADEQEAAEVTICVACEACQATGLYHGFAEPSGVHVICLKCGGSGARLLTYTPFTGRRHQEGVERVMQSQGTFIATGVGPTGDSMSYQDFLEAIPAVSPSEN